MDDARRTLRLDKEDGISAKLEMALLPNCKAH